MWQQRWFSLTYQTASWKGTEEFRKLLLLYKLYCFVTLQSTLHSLKCDSLQIFLKRQCVWVPARNEVHIHHFWRLATATPLDRPHVSVLAYMSGFSFSLDPPWSWIWFQQLASVVFSFLHVQQTKCCENCFQIKWLIVRANNYKLLN